MNDISELGATAGKPRDSLTFKQALLVIEQLAGLHAQFWQKNLQNSQYKWLAGPVRRMEDLLGTVLAVPLMKFGLKKAGHLIPVSVHSHAIKYARHRRRVMHFLTQEPQTIVHHDCHPGNLFWTQTKPGLLDWQMVRIGEGISDLSYFLATSLQPEIRRKNELLFIQHYLKNLDDNGVQNLDFEQMLERYRVHLIYSFEAMVITLAVGGMMEVRTNLKLIKRTLSAIQDNETFSLLPLTIDRRIVR